MDKPSIEIDRREAGDDGQNGLFGGDGADVVLSGDDLEFHLEDRTGEHGLFGGDGWDRMSGQKDGLFGGAGDDSLFGGDGADSLFGGDGADVLLQNRIIKPDADESDLEVTGLRLDNDDSGLF